jgi:vitamin B12 transporter
LQNALDENYGRPSRGCADNTTDGPFQCSSPYIYQNLGLPRTLRASYSYAF